MKNGRWITALGSLILFALALLHGSGYVSLVRRIQSAGIAVPLDGILKASWLTFSSQFLAFAVITFVASRMERGGWIVVLCAMFTLIDAAILLYFLGPFVGVYSLALATALFFIGGWMQTRRAS